MIRVQFFSSIHCRGVCTVRPIFHPKSDTRNKISPQAILSLWVLGRMSPFLFTFATADGQLVGGGRSNECDRCCRCPDCLVDVLVSLPQKNGFCKAGLYLVACADKCFDSRLQDRLYHHNFDDL